MAEKSGFFNALNIDGVYDRKYNADDYSNNLAAIISNGVRRSGDNDLYVQANGSNMALTINPGWAFISGKYYHNNAIHTAFTVPTAPTGDSKRIDRIVIRKDESTNVRSIKLQYLTGTPAANPTAPALTRSGDIYEIAIADIAVNSSVTAITQSNIIDQRANAELCGWVTSPVGYDDYWKAQDEAFENWFLGVKNKVASVTLFKEFHWHGAFESAGASITFDIAQYDPTGVDIVQVYINGLRAVPEVDYTLNNSTITFVNEVVAETEVHVVVYKSIDGTGLGSVSEEITQLQNQVAVLSNFNEFIYVCNGVNDNVKISELAQEFLNGGADYETRKIRVIGNFGVSAAYAGAGTTTNPFRWISVGAETAKNRRIIFDFTGCSQLNFPIAAGTYNSIFYGLNAHIIGANVVVNQTGEGTVVKIFSSANGAVRAEHCRFWLTCYRDSSIANTGTFINCRGSVANVINNSYCFLPFDNSLLRVEGGEYYAYTGVSTSLSAIVGQSAANAVSILYGVNAPTVARSGYYQTNAVAQYAGGGIMNVTDLVSALTVTVVAGISNIRGTIEKSKAGLM